MTMTTMKVKMMRMSNYLFIKIKMFRDITLCLRVFFQILREYLSRARVVTHIFCRVLSPVNLFCYLPSLALYKLFAVELIKMMESCVSHVCAEACGRQTSARDLFGGKGGLPCDILVS